VVGKGRDFIFDFSSTLNLVRERKVCLKEEEGQVDDGTGKVLVL
jgi:hypothetical protein